MSSKHLFGLLASRLDSAAREWLSQKGSAPSTSTPGMDASAFHEAFSAAGRRLGHRPLAPPGEPLGPGLPPAGCGAALLGRVALLLRAQEVLEAERLQSLVTECYRRGDSAERQAVLRALPLLDEPRRFLELARDACRTHVQPVFEALACDNPYPAAHFDEAAFNQLVLKAVFIGVALGRVQGLQRRLNPELARMAADYGRERRAARRAVPRDLSLLLPPGVTA